MTSSEAPTRPKESCRCGDPRGPVCPDCCSYEQAERARRLQARRMASQLPSTLQGFTLDDLEVRSGQAKAIEAAREWAKERSPRSLVLVGEVGRGKTHIAAAACWTRLERWPCKYASVAQCMARLGHDFGTKGRQEAVQLFAGTGSAVLDDLDKVRATEYGKEQLFAAIDGRQQAGAALLVTTNLTPDEIGEMYGDPIMSRLAAPYSRLQEVGGPDWRLA